MDYDVEPNSTTGIWIGADDVELFEEFDAYFQTYGRHEGTYSRGERVKEAMRIYMAVHNEFRTDDEIAHPDTFRLNVLRDSFCSRIKYGDDE